MVAQVLAEPLREVCIRVRLRLSKANAVIIDGFSSLCWGPSFDRAVVAAGRICLITSLIRATTSGRGCHSFVRSILVIQVVVMRVSPVLLILGIRVHSRRSLRLSLPVVVGVPSMTLVVVSLVTIIAAPSSLAASRVIESGSRAV